MIKNQRERVRSYGVEELRNLLGIPEGKYTRVSNLKEKIINRAIQEVYNKTPFIITCENIYLGGRIIGFRLVLNTKDYTKLNFAGEEVKLKTKDEQLIIGCVDRLKRLQGIQMTPTERNTALKHLENQYGKDVLRKAKGRIK